MTFTSAPRLSQARLSHFSSLGSAEARSSRPKRGSPTTSWITKNQPSLSAGMFAFASAVSARFSVASHLLERQVEADEVDVRPDLRLVEREAQVGVLRIRFALLAGLVPEEKLEWSSAFSPHRARCA